MEQSPLQALDQELQNHPQRRAIQRSIVSLLEIAKGSTDADEWRLINGTLADLRDGLSVFAPHRQTRKVTVFGSARTHSEEPAYKLAQELAVEAVARGFEVMTGAGGGIMEAANSGAGCENSIGLNVDLPFEQHANRFVNSCDGRLLHFRYFFTRKLMFVKECDAVVCLPGGFGILFASTVRGRDRGERSVTGTEDATVGPDHGGLDRSGAEDHEVDAGGQVGLDGFHGADAAADLDDLKNPPGNRLHALRAERAGQHSISINNLFTRLQKRNRVV